MFKEADSKLVPNQFLFSEDAQYVKSSKTKSKIKGKIIANKQPFADQTNKLSSMQNSVKAQNLQLIGYQTDSNNQIQENDQKQNHILGNNSLGFQSIIKSEQTNNQLQKNNKQLSQNVKTHFNAKSQNKQIIAENQQSQKKNPQIVKKHQFDRKKIFNLNFESSNQSQTQQNKSIEQQKVNQENQVKNIFQQLKPVPKRNISKFNVEFSEGSSSQQTIKQAAINPNLSETNSEHKNIILNKFDSNSQNQQCQNNQKQSESDCDDEYCQIIRNMNIKKLKTHFQYIQSEINFLAFCPIPQQNKISLIVKRNTSKSQYTVYDNQLVTLIMKVERTIGGNYKFIFNKDDKSNDLSTLDVIAKMKSNFIGTQFHCYTYKQNNSKKQKYQCISINYDVNILGLNGPRKVKLYATKKPIPSQQNLLQIYSNFQKNDKNKENTNGQYVGIKLYQNKNPKWMQEMNAYVLNLRGTAAHSSIKNCIIVDSTNQNKQHLIFGKKAKDIFNLEVKHPMTILQGVAFAVSSFERKLACQ